MNGKALLAGLLALALVVPGAFAEDPPEPGHDMAPEAKVLTIPFPANWFLPDPSYPQDYDSKAQLDIYGAKHMNPTAYPPLIGSATPTTPSAPPRARAQQVRPLRRRSS